MILGQLVQARGHLSKVQIKSSSHKPVHLESTDSRGEGATKEEEYLEVTESDCMDSLLSKWTNPTWTDQKSMWHLVHYVGPKEF